MEYVRVRQTKSYFLFHANKSCFRLGVVAIAQKIFLTATHVYFCSFSAVSFVLVTQRPKLLSVPRQTAKLITNTKHISTPEFLVLQNVVIFKSRIMSVTGLMLFYKLHFSLR